MPTDNKIKRGRKPNLFLSVIISWLGKEYVKITFDNEKVEAEIAEIRELLREDIDSHSHAFSR